MLPENCWICGRLFCLCDKSPSVEASSEEIAAAELIGELIAVGTSGVPLPDDALQLSNESMPSVLGDKWLVRSAKQSQLSRSYVHHMFRECGTRVSLPLLVRFCTSNQLSLAALARGEAIHRPCDKPGARIPRSYKRANPAVITEELRRTVATGGVRSVNSVAKKLGRSSKTLTAVAPHLVHTLKLANAAFRVAERNSRAAMWEEECHRVVDALLGLGWPLTLRNAQKVTGQPWSHLSKRGKTFLRIRTEVE